MCVHGTLIGVEESQNSSSDRWAGETHTLNDIFLYYNSGNKDDGNLSSVACHNAFCGV